MQDLESIFMLCILTKTTLKIFSEKHGSGHCRSIEKNHQGAGDIGSCGLCSHEVRIFRMTVGDQSSWIKKISNIRNKEEVSETIFWTISQVQLKHQQTRSTNPGCPVGFDVASSTVTKITGMQQAWKQCLKPWTNSSTLLHFFEDFETYSAPKPCFCRTYRILDVGIRIILLYIIMFGSDFITVFLFHMFFRELDVSLDSLIISDGFFPSFMIQPPILAPMNFSKLPTWHITWELQKIVLSPNHFQNPKCWFQACSNYPIFGKKPSKTYGKSHRKPWLRCQ